MTRIWVKRLLTGQTLADVTAEEYDIDNLPGFLLELRGIIEDKAFIKMAIHFAEARYFIAPHDIGVSDNFNAS